MCDTRDGWGAFARLASHDDVALSCLWHNSRNLGRALAHCCFMIAGRNRRKCGVTARDHDPRPECLNLKSRHYGI